MQNGTIVFVRLYLLVKWVISKVHFAPNGEVVLLLKFYGCVNWFIVAALFGKYCWKGFNYLFSIIQFMRVINRVYKSLLPNSCNILGFLIDFIFLTLMSGSQTSSVHSIPSGMFLEEYLKNTSLYESLPMYFNLSSFQYKCSSMPRDMVNSSSLTEVICSTTNLT